MPMIGRLRGLRRRLRPPHAAAIVRADEPVRSALGCALAVIGPLVRGAFVPCVQGCGGVAWNRVQPVCFALDGPTGAVASPCRQRDVPQQSRDRWGLHFCRFAGRLCVVTATCGSEVAAKVSCQLSIK